MKKLLDIDRRLFFILLCLISLLLLIAKKILIENETVAFEVLAMEGRMGVFHAINQLQYLSIPIIYLWKFTLIGFVLWVGCFMFGYKVSYLQCWQVSMVAESIFIIPEVIKIIWFLSSSHEVSFAEVRTFYPLSVASALDLEILPNRWWYPLKALNLFEVIYWLLLIQGIHLMAKKRIQIARNIVLGSYVLFFFLWLGFYLIVYK